MRLVDLLLEHCLCFKHSFLRKLKLAKLFSWNIILKDGIHEIDAKESWSLEEHFHYILKLNGCQAFNYINY